MNNPFGDLQFGQLNDQNIASTMLGVAVKCDNSWRLYNKQKGTIMDIGDAELGNLPIFVCPAIKVAVGDLIRDNKEYLYITKVREDGITTVNAATGEKKEVVPVVNPFGFKMYTKVMALDLMSGKKDATSMMLMMSAMNSMQPQTAPQNSMGNLLPMYYMMKNGSKEGTDQDQFFKMMMMGSMFGGGGGMAALMFMPEMMEGLSGMLEGLEMSPENLLLLSSMGGGANMLPFMMGNMFAGDESAGEDIADDDPSDEDLDDKETGAGEPGDEEPDDS